MPTKQTRSTLQGYFKTGEIPTEQQFDDLIDSVIVQGDDGVSINNNTKEIDIDWKLKVNADVEMAKTLIVDGASTLNSTLQVNGSIQNPMWKVTQVLNGEYVNGTPKMSGTFSSSGGTLILFVSGTDYSEQQDVIAELSIFIDKQGTSNDNQQGKVGQIEYALNTTLESAHFTFPTISLVVPNIAPAPHHTLSLSVNLNRKKKPDPHIHYYATVLELPF